MTSASGAQRLSGLNRFAGLPLVARIMGSSHGQPFRREAAPDMFPCSARGFAKRPGVPGGAPGQSGLRGMVFSLAYGSAFGSGNAGAGSGAGSGSRAAPAEALRQAL